MGGDALCPDLFGLCHFQFARLRIPVDGIDEEEGIWGEAYHGFQVILWHRLHIDKEVRGFWGESFDYLRAEGVIPAQGVPDSYNKDFPPQSVFDL